MKFSFTMVKAAEHVAVVLAKFLSCSLQVLTPEQKRGE